MSFPKKASPITTRPPARAQTLDGKQGGMPSLSCAMSSEHGSPACSISDWRNKRTPQSLMVRISGSEPDESFVALVDCTQAMKRQICVARNLLGGFQLDAVMITAGQVENYLGVNDLREV